MESIVETICKTEQTKYVIGLDYGTLSARAVLVCVHSGEVIAESIYPYPHGILTTLPVSFGTAGESGRAGPGCAEEKLPADYALQEIDDYVEAMYHTIREVVEKAGCRPDDVIGIGIDATSSTFLPLMQDSRPLGRTEQFAENPHAQLKLWKHHGAQAEADRITALAKEREIGRASCRERV